MQIDTDLIAKYNSNGPRYTSYPTALEFEELFSSEDYIRTLGNTEGDTLSLYIHIPFCRNICYYCACNKIITKDSSKADKYIEYLIKEAQLIADNLASKKVGQIHFGGGTPTFLTREQLAFLIEELKSLFQVEDTAEISIEVDPRSVDKGIFAFFQELGINRVSIGVQDFNPKVQTAVNRVHDFESVAALFEEARALNFKSINMDLIYGLPFQTTESIAETLEQVIELKPQRIAFYNYAHLPHRFKPQRRINSDDLPSAEQKIAIFQLALNALTEAGYRYIGMDHFALSDDSLAIAQENGVLHRNFQGYTTHKDLQLVGLGVSSISKVANCYSQNFTSIEEYYKRLDSDQLPVWRGCSLDLDDELRRELIMQLICNFKLDIKTLEAKYPIDFKQYFSHELEQLEGFAEDQLLIIDLPNIEVTQRGRYFIRNICMTFDKYLQELNELKAFSKVI